jgi:hypothetical protein
MRLVGPGLAPAWAFAGGGRVGEGAMRRHDTLSPRQTGRADFPHPAFTQTLATQQYAGRKADLAGQPSLDLR